MMTRRRDGRDRIGRGARLVPLLLLVATVAHAQIAVRGDTVYTMAGPPIEDGVVLLRDGTIEQVGPGSEVVIPAGYRTLTATVVTPGLIDAHSVVGLAGYLNQEDDQDMLDRAAPIQPELRAIDAYDPSERLVEWLRGFGITTIHTGHGPGALVSGQTMVVKTVGRSVDDAVVLPTAMVAATLGESARAARGQSPGTRGKMVAMLRGELVKAQEYVQRLDRAEPGDEPATDLRLESLARVLSHEWPLLVTAHRARDILTAIRIATEFDVKIVLDGAAEAYLVIDEIKDAGVPVIVHPTMYRATGETENLSFETAATLKAAGIPIALQSGYESYVPRTRVVLFEAGVAAAHGLNFEEALGTITIEAATILGIANRVGSLEVGKDADVALFDGDPFEYTTHCIGVIANGEVVSQEVR
ncbi:MAG: amidohydrolase family protein [Vicinamibacterales bacterium]